MQSIHLRFEPADRKTDLMLRIASDMVYLEKKNYKVHIKSNDRLEHEKCVGTMGTSIITWKDSKIFQVSLITLKVGYN